MKLDITLPGIDTFHCLKPFIVLQCLPILILISWQSDAGAQGENLKVLETVNSFYGHWCCANNGYLYGTDVNNRINVFRKTESGQSIETRGSVTSIDPSFTIEYKIFSTSTPGLIFVLVGNNSGYFLLKSSDGAATFQNVFTFGKGNGIGGTNSPDTRILRGILELTTEIPGGGGIGTLFLGEYNVNSSRVRGSTNDRVRIMKSVDNGDTWTKVVEWNTNGLNQVGHIHAMKQDPYTGEIYICVGDDNSKSGIIKWNGSAGWTDNRTLADIGKMEGFRVLTGAQRYRVCDILFDEQYFYTIADTQTPNNPTGSESGIWRGVKDLSSFKRVDNKIYNYDPMHVGWFGEKIGNNLIFTTAREYIDPGNAWKELNTQVYISTDGSNWYTSGILNWRDNKDPTLGRYIRNVFSFNNKLYVDCVEGAGHTSTIQCEFSKEWKPDDDPVILHPVYFVGTWNGHGNDANSGVNADAPKLTLNSALASNRICAGARVRISSGNFSETNIYPVWSGAGLQGSGSVVIEGQGMDKTHIIRSSGIGNTYGIRVEAARTLTNANTPLIFKDLDFFITVDGGTNHNNNVFTNIDSYIKTTGCRIGNVLNDDSPLINLATAGTKYVSENSIHIANNYPSSFKSIVDANAINTVISLKNCIILNAYDAFINDYSGINLCLKNCTFYGIERYAVVFHARNNTQPEIKNCIFVSRTAPIYDLSGLTETNVDYNLYNIPNVNTTDGGHSLIGVDPLFVDALNGNFNLQSNSPCGMKGIYFSDVIYDLERRRRRNPPNIGAYESPVMSVSPSDITIPSTSGASGEFNITSSARWHVSDIDTWLNLSSTSGTGNGKIIVTATNANKMAKPRRANVSFFSSGLNPVAVTVMQAGTNPILSVAPSDITIASTSGATGNFNITSNTNWSATGDATWLILSSASGAENETLTITTNSANNSIHPRSANVTFSASGTSAVTVTVTQSGTNPALIVAPSAITIESFSESAGSFNISSNTIWNVTDDATWLTLSSASGAETGIITVTTTSANNSIHPRSANVTFSASGASAVIVTVTQSGSNPTLAVAPSAIAITSNSESAGSFNIFSNTNWHVTDDATWLSLSSTSDSGNVNVTVTTNSANNSIHPRSANVTFSAYGASAVSVTVTQSGANPTLSIYPSIITLASTALATNSFNITSNTNWSVTNDASWLILSTASGTENGKVTFTTKGANNSIHPRSANVTFSASGASAVTVTVTQSGENPTLSINPSTISLASTSVATSSFNITSNTNWSVTDYASWLNLSILSGTGNGTLTIKTTSANNSTIPRNAILTLSAPGTSAVIVKVTQSGAIPTLSVAPSAISVSSISEAKGSFNITSNTNWFVADDENWFNLSPTSGSGNGTLSVTSNSVNTSSNPRSTNIIFSADGVNPVIVKVTQVASIPIFSPYSTQNDDLKIFPNPVNGILTIEYKNDYFKAIHILNSIGIILYTERVLFPIQQLDFSNYENGLYILELVNHNGEIKRIKVVKSLIRGS